MRVYTWYSLGAAVAMTPSASQSCPDTWLPLPPHIPQHLIESLQQEIGEVLRKTVNESSTTSQPFGGDPTSAAMQVHYGGEVLASAFVGQRDPKARDGPPDETTIFRIGSVSKLFPVIMLYQLYERGVVQSVDDPVSKYEPAFRAINAYSSSKWQFTLRQLASQLSGLPRAPPCQLFQCNLSTLEILRNWNSTPGAIWPEYTEPSYSNFAYSLLGNVLSGAIGIPFPEYVKRNILDPLGMTNTGFVLPAEAVKHAAVAYANETQIPWYDLGWDAPSGQMYSTVRDLTKLCHFFLGFSGHHVLDGGLRRQLLLPDFLFRDGTFLTGSPWEIQLLPASRWMLLGKGGKVPGYSASLNLIPPLNLSMVVLWSGMVDTSGVSAAIFNRLLPGFMASLGPYHPSTAVPDSPSLYLGAYRADLPMMGSRECRISNATLPDGGWCLALVFSQRTAMWLDFKSKSEAVMVRGTSGWPASCYAKMVSARDREWVTFRFDGDGSVASLELPGLYYGFPFRRLRFEVQAGRARRPALRR